MNEWKKEQMIDFRWQKVVIETWPLPSSQMLDGDEDEMTSTVDPRTTQVWTAQVHSYADYFPINTLGPAIH